MVVFKSTKLEVRNKQLKSLKPGKSRSRTTINQSYYRFITETFPGFKKPLKISLYAKLSKLLTIRGALVVGDVFLLENKKINQRNSLSSKEKDFIFP